ncbi:MAG: HEAT repeat domain-containing protein [Marinagarivorans sp.]
MGFIRRTNPQDAPAADAPPDCQQVLVQLNQPDPVLRRRAAHAAVKCPGVSTALVAQLNTEIDPAVREALLSSLTHIADDNAITGLANCLRSEDTALRNETIDAMKSLNEVAAPVIRQLLKDIDPDVRIFAVNILESLKHPEVEHWLIEVISTDPHINVCATAVDLLGEVGTEQARAALEQLALRFAQEPYIQFAIRVALRRLHEA